MPGVTIPADRRVAIRIGYGETELREQVIIEGGFWNPERKAWLLSYHKVLRLGLERPMMDKLEGL